MAQVRDLDGDGASVLEGDCAEGDPARGPGAPEIWYDGIDQDCDGNDGDQDGDGWVTPEYAAEWPGWQALSGHAGLQIGDCWDDPADPTPLAQATPEAEIHAAEVHPGAVERWYDGVDQDCAQDSDFDQDGDGHDSAGDPQADGTLGDDCADGSPHDEVFFDLCGDGAALEVEDPAALHPGAEDLPYDGLDSDCDGADDWDLDGDGFRVCEECDDEDAAIFPSDTPERWYNCVDENCDGNDGDQDGDGWLADGYPALCADWATLNPGRAEGDCLDDPALRPSTLNGLGAPDAAAVHPGAVDTPYDGVDQDCAGDSGEFDADGDGFGAAAWSGPDGAPAGPDCDDDDPAIHPDAAEDCGTAADDNCDGQTNTADALGCTEFYLDADRDGFGTSDFLCLCQAREDLDYVSGVDGDCDDADPTQNPFGQEACDAANEDEDCDGLADDDDPSVDPSGTGSWSPDDDGDGYGDRDATPTVACDPPSAAWVEDASDCDDSDAGTHPGASEICDSANTDEDCDGVADDDDSAPVGRISWYPDDDGDGYGDDTSAGSQRCDPNATWAVSDNTDCDDTLAAVNPGAAEVCDSANTDEDCDGKADDSDSSTSSSSKSRYYRDTDKDGYGGTDYSNRCDANSAYTTLTTGDCDDGDAGIHPGAVELCDPADEDEDCDGLADDDDSSVSSTSKTRYYEDKDRDGYGSASALLCDAASPYDSTVGSDCDDSSASVNPGAQEICDSANTDEDCDGLADDKDSSTSSSTKSTWYVDADADGQGLEGSTGLSRCDASGAYTASSATDCDDSDATVYVGASDSCWDLTDQDCDDYVDEGGSSACYSGGELVFSELQFDPATASTHEWLEVTNTTAQDLTMEGMTLLNASSVGLTTRFVVADSVVVPAGGAVVLCDTDTPLPTCDYIYGSDQGFSSPLGASYSTLWSLPRNNNNTLSIEVGGGDHAAVVLDELNYDGSVSSSTWPGASSGYSFELSRVRTTATLNDNGAYWCRASIASSYYTSGGKSDYGTPGATNNCAK